jgi:hypothetical protein
VQPQLWQAVAGMRFRIIGGYALVASPSGSSTNYPGILRPTAVQRFLWAKATGGAPYPTGRVPDANRELACQLRAFLLRYRVDTVISTTADAQPQPIDALFHAALGSPTYVGGGATVWFHVPGDISVGQPSCVG